MVCWRAARFARFERDGRHMEIGTMKAAWYRAPRFWAPAGFLLAVQGMLWYRTGLYPAASTADDAWFSEAAYYFLHDGVLRRPWTADDLGGALKDFFPPVTSLIQAAFFKIFGFTAFGEMAQSSFACTLLSLLVTILVRRTGAAMWLALTAGIAIFGLQIVLEQVTRVRPEQWVTIFLMLCFLLRDMARDRDKGALFLAFGAGLFLGVACVAYYPSGPFVLIAGFIGTSLSRPSARRMALAQFIGGAVILLLFILYVSPAWHDFFAQELGTGHHYFTLEHLLMPLTGLFVAPEHGSWQGPFRFIMMAWEAALVAIACGLLLWKVPSGPARGYAWAALVLLPLFPLMGTPVTLVAAGIFFVLALASSASMAVPRNVARIAVAGIVVLALVGFAKVSALALVSYLQRNGRDYAAVSAQLDRLIVEPGRVGVDRAEWLALRPRLGREDLHWMMQSEYYEDFIFRSMVLRGPNASQNFRYLVLEPKRTLDTIARDYPGFRADIAAGRWRQIGRVTLPFRSLPLARNAPYDMIVYRRSGS